MLNCIPPLNSLDSKSTKMEPSLAGADQVKVASPLPGEPVGWGTCPGTTSIFVVAEAEAAESPTPLVATTWKV